MSHSGCAQLRAQGLSCTARFRRSFDLSGCLATIDNRPVISPVLSFRQLTLSPHPRANFFGLQIILRPWQATRQDTHYITTRARARFSLSLFNSQLRPQGYLMESSRPAKLSNTHRTSTSLRLPAISDHAATTHVAIFPDLGHLSCSHELGAVPPSQLPHRSGGAVVSGKERREGGEVFQ